MRSQLIGWSVGGRSLCFVCGPLCRRSLVSHRLSTERIGQKHQGPDVKDDTLRCVYMRRIYNPFDTDCCHMGTAIKHHVPDRIKSSFVIFDIRAL